MSLVMVRTVCCESFKCRGTRCSICPNRPENEEAVRKYKQDMATMSFGRRGRTVYPRPEEASPLTVLAAANR